MMHTCEIIARNYGYNPEDLCGLPATKSVVSHIEASGAPCKCKDGHVIWMCDEHYAHAVATWTNIPCDF
jgi:hypothetical protein